MERERLNKRLGTGKCPISRSGSYRVSQTKTGWISTICNPHEGGCNTQSFHRWDTSAFWAVSQITKWDRADDRRRLRQDIPPDRHADAADLKPDPEAYTTASRSIFAAWLASDTPDETPEKDTEE